MRITAGSWLGFGGVLVLLVGWLTGCVLESTAVLRPAPLPTVVPTVHVETAVSATPVPTLLPSPTPLPTATAVPTATPPANGEATVIGRSWQERPLEAYQFKNGATPIVFVGGIHGGYEWNTILLMYETIDYFQANPQLVPDDVTLIIIPSANPDGLYRVTGVEGRFWPGDVDPDPTLGRFNSREVDLNRNWDCDWQETSNWGDRQVWGGERPFSELETAALRDFFLDIQPAAVIFWHSAANGVFASGCDEMHLPSLELAQRYSEASGYPMYQQFFNYVIHGDAADWLSRQGIPAISVELINHNDLDWSQNLAGMLAVLAHYDSRSENP